MDAATPDPEPTPQEPSPARMPEPAPRTSALARARAIAPGLGVAVAIAIVATVIGRLVPIVGAPVSGIVIGVLLGLVLKQRAVVKPGITFASKFVLQLSVVVLGSQLSLAEVASVGLQSLPVMLGTLVICLGAAWLIGRWLGIVGDLRTLIGVGTGICGASAIAAVTPVIGAISVDVAYAISTIFLFNVVAVLLFPFVGHLLGLSQHAFGLFAGTAVNDTSSVVATAATYGAAATNVAVVVKLVRTLMIIPISLGLAAMVARRTTEDAAGAAGSGVAAGAGGAGAGAGAGAADAGVAGAADAGVAGAGAGAADAGVSRSDAAAASEADSRAASPAGESDLAAKSAGEFDRAATAAHESAAAGAAAVPPKRRRVRVFRLVPWFLIGFVIVAAVNSTGIIPTAAHPALSTVSVFLITIALSAIGLSTDVGGFRRAGPRPLILGASLWVVVALSSLGIMAVTGIH